MVFTGDLSHATDDPNQRRARLRQFQDMEHSGRPRDLLNWRFQQALYRAYYDAFVRDRLVYETGLETQALAALRQAGRAGSLAAMDEVEQQLMAAGGRIALRASSVGVGRWEARGQAAGGFLDRVSRRVQPLLERSWHILRVRILPPMWAM